MVPSSLLPQVLVAYNDALRATFYLITALTSATIVGSLAIEWKSIKKEQQEQNHDTAEDDEKQARPA
jgi:hypothetical protein